MTRVPDLQQIEFLALLLAGDALGKIEIENRRPRGTKERSLIAGRQIPITPNRHAVHRRPPGILDHGIAGQIAVRTTQTVGHPGADRGTPLELRSAIYMEGGRSMVVVVYPDAMAKGQDRKCVV